MAHDPVLNSAGLTQAFQMAASRGFTTSRTQEYAIYDNREPEVSFLLNDISVIHTIYDALARSRDVVIIPGSSRVNPGTLVSLAQDTVDNQGYPLRQIEASGHTLRSRFGFECSGSNTKFLLFDKSIKSIEKNDTRKEWEAACDSIDGGYDRLLVENPTLPGIFSTLDPESFRVSGVCLTSRAIYSFLHIVNKDTAVLYDACNDACVMTTPYADSPVGYRREYEYEAKAILRNSALGCTAEDFDRFLQTSIDSIRETIQVYVGSGIQETNESKLAHTQRAVQDHYETTFGHALSSVDARVKDGTDHALLQNVRPGDFVHMPQRENMRLLSRLIPKACHLLPERGQTQDYSDYFNTNHLNVPVLKIA